MFKAFKEGVGGQIGRPIQSERSPVDFERSPVRDQRGTFSSNTFDSRARGLVEIGRAFRSFDAKHEVNGGLRCNFEKRYQRIVARSAQFQREARLHLNGIPLKVERDHGVKWPVVHGA